MRAFEGSDAPEFRGSISRRLTILSVLFLVLVAVVGGLSVRSALRIDSLHDQSEELDDHIQALDRMEADVVHLRAETLDALFLGQAFDEHAIREIPREVREQWKRYEGMHTRGGVPWGGASTEERVLSLELQGTLESFLNTTESTLAAKPTEAPARGQAAALLHTEAHRLQEALDRLQAVHHALIVEQTRAAKAEIEFIRWTYLAFIGLGGLAVIAGTILFVRRMVVPLRQLNAAAADIAQGALERRVPVTSRDEIGRLALTFNQMAEALSHRDAEIRRRAQEAEALYRVGTEISSLLNIDRVISSVVQSARNLFTADAAGVALADGAAGEVRWILCVGDPADAVKEIRLQAGQGVAGRVLAAGTPVIVEDASREIADDPVAHPILAAEGLMAALAVPLRRGERTLGALLVAYRTARRFAEEEVFLLSNLANQVAMAMENAELYGQVQSLHRVGMQISSLLSLNRICQTVVENARMMLRTDVAGLCLRREGGAQLDLAAAAGPWNEIVGSCPAACGDEATAGRNDVCPRCREVHPDESVASLSAPLKRGDDRLGFLCVGSRTPRAFGKAEQNLLGGLAAQAAIAIENARLYEAVRGMATCEERERLAREMHDGLAQALGFLNLKLALAARMVDGDPSSPMRLALEEMRNVAANAYEEVRQAIFGLRTMVSRGLGLIPTLSEYLHEFSQQASLEVKLEVRQESDLARFAPEVEVQLVRIVQEALHNVRKHAGARTAWVRFWREGEDILMSIEDDGVGFDPGATPVDGRRHFGLATMRERAESVGGDLTVQSLGGTGTQVVVRLPLAAAQRGGTGVWERRTVSA
ncbi:MAG TPA: GAF domain-containing protein [archaeon]|nr:GAF domain-containing protein [archaeon]